MRWDSLFEDLESQLQAQLEAQFRDEVAENIRIERATEKLAGKLASLAGCTVHLHLAGSVEAVGTVGPMGEDYVCLDAEASSLLVTVKAIQRITMASPSRSAALPGPEPSPVKLPALLRGLLRDRSRMRIHDGWGKLLAEGTPTQIGHDFLIIAAHPQDEFPRESSITEHSIVPLAAIGWISIPRGY